MNFQQLRIIREAVRRDFNLTEVANALFTSQSGVSKHIKDIEDELGIELFIRRGKRLTGLTELDKKIAGIVERIATEALENEPGLVTFPWYDWHHSVIVPAEHPLTRKRAITLTDLADYPLITYHESVTGGSRIDRAFSAIGISPDVVMSALDADVIKTYVELNLGIGIIASMAFNPLKDTGLVLLDGSALFSKNTTRIAIRQGHYLRGYAYRFLELCSKRLQEEVVRAALTPNKDELG